MAISEKQRIRGTRILLTVFYGFLLSSILFRYIIHGVVEVIRQPTNPYAIIMIVLGTLMLISAVLAIYGTWFDNTMIMLISAIVLICVFVLTLIFGIIRIVNTAQHQVPTVKTGAGESSETDSSNVSGSVGSGIDKYSLSEDIAKLITELLVILFAIFAAFILFRYLKRKYDPVATTETKTT